MQIIAAQKRSIFALCQWSVTAVLFVTERRSWRTGGGLEVRAHRDFRLHKQHNCSHFQTLITLCRHCSDHRASNTALQRANSLQNGRRRSDKHSAARSRRSAAYFPPIKKLKAELNCHFPTARVSLVSVLDERASTFLSCGVRGQPLHCLPARHGSRMLSD